MSKNYDVPELFCAALEYLDHAIEISYWNQHQEEFKSPIGNTGASYDGGTFKLRAFDWSEPDEYEPNFEWRDVKVWWYKYLGRVTCSNKELTPEIINEMLNDCLNNISKKSKDELEEV